MMKEQKCISYENIINQLSHAQVVEIGDRGQILETSVQFKSDWAQIISRI